MGQISEISVGLTFPIILNAVREERTEHYFPHNRRHYNVEPKNNIAITFQMFSRFASTNARLETIFWLYNSYNFANANKICFLSLKIAVKNFEWQFDQLILGSLSKAHSLQICIQLKNQTHIKYWPMKTSEPFWKIFYVCSFIIRDCQTNAITVNS